MTSVVAGARSDRLHMDARRPIDGRVKSSDARLIQRCAVGEFECVPLADVTCDGDVNSSDARIIQRFSVGEFEESALFCEELASCP